MGSINKSYLNSIKAAWTVTKLRRNWFPQPTTTESSIDRQKARIVCTIGTQPFMPAVYGVNAAPYGDL